MQYRGVMSCPHCQYHCLPNTHYLWYDVTLTIRVVTSLSVCLCVCNQWAYADNSGDAVDLPLILFGKLFGSISDSSVQ